MQRFYELLGQFGIYCGNNRILAGIATIMNWEVKQIF